MKFVFVVCLDKSVDSLFYSCWHCLTFSAFNGVLETHHQPLLPGNSTWKSNREDVSFLSIYSMISFFSKPKCLLMNGPFL